MFFIFMLGVIIIGLIYCILFNWKALFTIIGGLIALALTFAVGTGVLFLLVAWLGSL